ncbi:MAG TPA: DUF1801 domain-containing protein [Chloroflexi bacterium]|jgi:uncharacterized protein YdhG (YjbR/CyaY superfamily)|nr:DUF1801 domain-containing protein [Anaerolineaceae bacterium]HHX07905.1 DUF1801 domain-containing protein [Chloroflexota bacterium]
MNQKNRQEADDVPGSGFSKIEKEAMKQRAKELKAKQNAAASEQEVLEKINEMSDANRQIATQLHKLVKDHFPELTCRTWYGMPAYAKGGKVLCFFQNGDKFGSRYNTLGFSDLAQLDEGSIWPSSYALTEWNAEVEAEITRLIKKAIG